MNPFRRKRELEAEIQQSEEEVQEVNSRDYKIEKLRTSLQEHMKDNNFGSRLYTQMIENWK